MYEYKCIYTHYYIYVYIYSMFGVRRLSKSGFQVTHHMTQRYFNVLLSRMQSISSRCGSTRIPSMHLIIFQNLQTYNLFANIGLERRLLVFKNILTPSSFPIHNSTR